MIFSETPTGKSSGNIFIYMYNVCEGPGDSRDGAIKALMRSANYTLEQAFNTLEVTQKDQESVRRMLSLP